MPADSIHHSRSSHSADGNAAATSTPNSITVNPAMPAAAIESAQRRPWPERANRQMASAPHKPPVRPRQQPTAASSPRGPASDPTSAMTRSTPVIHGPTGLPPAPAQQRRPNSRRSRAPTPLKTPCATSTTACPWSVPPKRSAVADTARATADHPSQRHGSGEDTVSASPSRMIAIEASPSAYTNRM